MTKTVLLKENEFIIEVYPEGIRARNPHKPDNKHFLSLLQTLKMFDDVMYHIRQNAQRNATPPPDGSQPSPLTDAQPYPASAQQESSLPPSTPS